MTVDLALIFAGLTVVLVLAIVLWGVRSLLQEYRKDRVPALLYHHFAPKTQQSEDQQHNYDPVYFCYDTAFDEQMNYLHREGYRTISLNDFTAFQDGKQPLPDKPIIITFDDGFMSNYLYAFPVLKKYDLTATIFTTVDPNCRNFRKYAGIDSPLTQEQIKEMSDYGIAIESHSMTHPYLSRLKPEVARWELEESKSRLQDILGKPVHYLAIPSGAYDRAVKRLVKKAGYRAAFCMLKGTNNKDTDPFALRRLVIGRDFTLEDFSRILQPAAACYLRLTSSVQNFLLHCLGPTGLDMLRSAVYRFKLGETLIRGQLRFVLPGVIVTMVALLFGGLSLVLRSYF